MVGYIGWVNTHGLGPVRDRFALWIFTKTYGSKWYLAMEARAEAASTGENLAEITRRKTEEAEKIHRQMSSDVAGIVEEKEEKVDNEYGTRNDIWRVVWKAGDIGPNQWLTHIS